MVDNKRPRLVGHFIRQRREALGLSQRALGLMFNPPVTTQFISNVERGVTPLPPAHIPTLTLALKVNEAEFMALLEQEYAFKLSGRLGAPAAPNGVAVPGGSPMPSAQALSVSDADYAFMRNLYEAFAKADSSARQEFVRLVDKILKSSPPAQG